MRYRQDIDGLRAIAVLCVLLFHFGFDSLSGGFAGVDIFFVISGYLITSILLKEIDDEHFSFLQFYEKRIRRLYPALIAVVLSSFIAAYFIFMPDEFKEFGQSMVSTITYLSNLFFWYKSDYFSGPSDLKPLLHTWSLAVEEQFYLIFPLVLWLTYKRSRLAMNLTVLALFVISFLLAILSIESIPSGVFYLSPFRFWELLFGSLVAIALRRNWSPNSTFSPILEYTGLALVIGPIFWLDEHSQFPGWAAVPSCLGAALLLWTQDKSTVVYKILTLPVMRFTGKISYSLYLWHWPIVVFYGYWIIREFEIWEKFAMMAVTFIVSWLSWRYIESPFRLTKQAGFKPKQVYGYAFSSTLLIFVVGALVWQQNGMPQRFPNLKIETLAQTRTESGENHCFLNTEQDFSLWKANECLIESTQSKQTVLLWGDSHANHLVAGLTANRDLLPYNILVYSSAGCPPIIGQSLPTRPNCLQNNQHVLDIIKTMHIKNVIMAGNWAYSEKADHLDIAKLPETINALKENGVQPMIINQLPLYPISNPQYLATRLASRDNPKEDYFIKPDDGLDMSVRIMQLLPNTQIFDAFKLFCPDESCSIFKNGELMVVDRGHLSHAGSRYLTKAFLKDSKSQLTH
tara:strand:+ start:3485 stop:5371 length:1887 start_codon:yes stop_codon:yes gene_type:complete